MSYDLSDTMHVRSVVVTEARCPLRMVPHQGCDGTEFKGFVDVFDPKSVTDDTYQVKAVIDHRFKDIGPRSKGGRRRKQLEYLVHWKGYTKREATWKPPHHLKDAEETVLNTRRNTISIKWWS